MYLYLIFDLPRLECFLLLRRHLVESEGIHPFGTIKLIGVKIDLHKLMFCYLFA